MHDLAGHYSRLAPSYDRFWSVDEDFVEDTAAAIAAALDLGPETASSTWGAARGSTPRRSPPGSVSAGRRWWSTRARSF